MFILYGQSNMAAFSDPAVSSSPPAAAANTAFYDGSSITTVPAGNGIREFLNALTAATGRYCFALNGSIGGTPTSGLIKGSAGYTALMAQINAVILPTDRVFILWDQGEGNADAAPHPDENSYKATINQLHADLVADMGLTKSTCQFLMAGLGTTSAADGAIDNGTTNEAWQTIKNAIYNCSLEQSENHFSHTNIDLVRTDIYHYDAVSQGKQGKRFAQTVKSILHRAVGEPPWQISSGTTVDATHTNINVIHSLGTDFTPTSGGDGWEVTGNNGATWITATAARNSATQIQLTHASISTTSTRKVRYQWGILPPGASGNNPTTAPILDNSALAVPLNPTTWDIQPTALTTVPVPTWRYAIALTGTGQVQTATSLPLGPSSGGQRFLILSFTCNGLDGVLTVTPNVGSPVKGTQVKRQNNVQIQQVLLGTDANSATTVNVSIDYGTNPFAGGVVQLWTVPFADMSSATATGTGGASASANTAATTTVNVSAGGFIIEVAKTDTQYSTVSIPTGTESFAKRFDNGSPYHSFSADASNGAANASSSATATFAITGNIDIALAAWR